MKVRIFGQLDYYAPAGQLGLKMAGIDPRFTLGELSPSRATRSSAGWSPTACSTPIGAVPCRRSRSASASSPASAPRPGTTSTTSSNAAASGSSWRSATRGCRASGRRAMVAGAIRTLARPARPRLRSSSSAVAARATSSATFDAEPIARAIAASPIPVLTGLGHEVDRSVADEVAHTAFKTPTACAAALIDAVDAYRSRERSARGRDRAPCRRPNSAAPPTPVTDRAHRIARRTHAAVERAEERLATRVDRIRARRPAPARRRRTSSTPLSPTVCVVRRRQLLAAEERHLDAHRRRGWRCSIRPTCCAEAGASRGPATACRALCRRRRARRRDRHAARRWRASTSRGGQDPRSSEPMTTDRATRLCRRARRARRDPARARRLRRRRRPARRSCGAGRRADRAVP